MSGATFDELVRAVREMRRLQRGFFASAQGSQERQAYLRESRRLERDVDRLLAELESPQLGLMEAGWCRACGSPQTVCECEVPPADGDRGDA